jgi:hypothetical protein
VLNPHIAHQTQKIAIFCYLRWFCLAMLVFVAGCASNDVKRRVEDLDKTVRAYEKLIRWGYFEDAAAFRRARPSSPTPLAYNADRYRDIRVTSYDEAKRTLSSTGKEAAVVSEIGFYRTDMGIVKALRYPQLWWYSATEKHWFLDSDLPDFNIGENIGPIRLH